MLVKRPQRTKYLPQNPSFHHAGVFWNHFFCCSHEFPTAPEEGLPWCSPVPPSIKHQVQRELDGHRFVFTSHCIDPHLLHRKENTAGKECHQCKSSVNPPHFSLLSLRASDKTAEFNPFNTGTHTAWQRSAPLLHDRSRRRAVLGQSWQHRHSLWRLQLAQAPPAAAVVVENTLWQGWNTFRSWNEVVLSIPPSPCYRYSFK